MSYTQSEGKETETEEPTNLPKRKLEYDSTKEVTEYKLECKVERKTRLVTGERPWQVPVQTACWSTVGKVLSFSASSALSPGDANQFLLSHSSNTTTIMTNVTPNTTPRWQSSLEERMEVSRESSMLPT
jgi:hypothetical protein